MRSRTTICRTRAVLVLGGEQGQLGQVALGIEQSAGALLAHVILSPDEADLIAAELKRAAEAARQAEDA